MMNSNFTLSMKIENHNLSMQVTGDTPINELTDRMLQKIGKDPQEFLSKKYFFQIQDKTIDLNSTCSLSSCGLSEGSIVSVVNQEELEKKNQQLKEQENKINTKQQGLRHRFKKKIDTAVETETIKDTLEDMAILGSIKKVTIRNEANKYYSIDEALNNEDYQIVALGMLASNLKSLGIDVVIEKEEATDNVDKQIAANNLLQFLVNGYIYKSKYHFAFNLPLDQIQALNNKEEERLSLIQRLKGKLIKEMKEYGLKEEDLIVTYYPQVGSFELLVIFKVSEIIDLTKNLLFEKYKFRLDGMLRNLSSVEKTPIIEAVILNKAMLDYRGDNKDGGWGFNETRGGEEYNPPEGWVRYGVRVYQQYDNGNNDWLSYDNRPGEWCIAYHEITRKDNINPIELYENDDDIKHPGKKVGRGTYCTPYPIFMEDYASFITIKNKNYLIGFMLRVKPEKIRIPSKKDEYWVVNGTPDEIRPYGLLVKELDQ